MRNKIILRIFLVQLIIISVCQTTFAQSEISGFVKSSITDLKPITDVYIEITNANKIGLERMTMTDSLGFFRFSNLKSNKTYILKSSAFGYANQIFKITANSGITKTTLTLNASCDFSREQAEIDWKMGRAKLLLVGSIAPIASTSADKHFEKKFNIEYYDFGCMPPTEECIIIYNERIFELMDEKHGKGWREKVRPDVEYLN